MPYSMPYEEWLQRSGIAGPSLEQIKSAQNIQGQWNEWNTIADEWGEHTAWDRPSQEVTPEQKAMLALYDDYRAQTHRKTGLSSLMDTIGTWKAPLLALGGAIAFKGGLGQGLGSAKAGGGATGAGKGALTTKLGAAGAGKVKLTIAEAAQKFAAANPDYLVASAVDGSGALTAAQAAATGKKLIKMAEAAKAYAEQNPNVEVASGTDGGTLTAAEAVADPNIGDILDVAQRGTPTPDTGQGTETETGTGTGGETGGVDPTDVPVVTDVPDVGGDSGDILDDLGVDDALKAAGIGGALLGTDELSGGTGGNPGAALSDEEFDRLLEQTSQVTDQLLAPPEGGYTPGGPFFDRLKDRAFEADDMYAESMQGLQTAGDETYGFMQDLAQSIADMPDDLLEEIPQIRELANQVNMSFQEIRDLGRGLGQFDQADFDKRFTPVMNRLRDEYASGDTAILDNLAARGLTHGSTHEIDARTRLARDFDRATTEAGMGAQIEQMRQRLQEYGARSAEVGHARTALDAGMQPLQAKLHRRSDIRQNAQAAGQLMLGGYGAKSDATQQAGNYWDRTFGAAYDDTRDPVSAQKDRKAQLGSNYISNRLGLEGTQLTNKTQADIDRARRRQGTIGDIINFAGDIFSD